VAQSSLRVRALKAREGLIDAMMNPAFYPKPPAQVIRKETHISDVFLAGDLVYKLKKAVRYPFLDYSTLSKRRHFLQEELRLNRRLAPSVYLAVMPITFDSRGWRLGGWDAPAEYTLVMRRLPERRMLAALVDSGQVNAQMMRDLADALASFHLHAKSIETLERDGYDNEVEKDWNETLSELRPFAGRLMAGESLTMLEDFGVGFITRYREVLVHRGREGWIRDVHGDLRCEHVCFAPEGIQIYDCIEFSAKLRRCDLASEIAFFLMDLAVFGGRGLRAAFLNRYIELVSDPDLLLLLPFYECYHALARAKVEALRPQTATERAPRYFEYARHLLTAITLPANDAENSVANPRM
jgi:aminoglycoside phosphotransferase family enzyme